MGPQVFFPNNMPPTPPVTPANRTSKRRASWPALGGPPKRKTGARVAGNSLSLTDKPASITIRRKKGVRNKKSKKVKISRAFKKKVKQVIEPLWEKGTLKTVTFGGGIAIDQMSADRQVTFDTINSAFDGGMMFTMDYFIHAIARLWGDSTGPTTAAPTTTYLKPNVAGRAYGYQKFRIIDSYTQIHYKNNSSRTIYLKLHVCKPKKKGAFRIDSPVSDQAYDDTGTAVDNADAMNPPNVCWSAQLLNAFQTGTITNGQGGVLSQTTVGETPGHVPGFNTNWSYETISVKLLPAQEYSLKVQGPSDKLVTQYSMYNQRLWQNVQKYTRGLITVVQLDMVATTDGESGRMPPPLTSTTFLSMERHDYIKLSMPQSDVTLGNRKDRYVSMLINDGVLSGTPQEITLQNPVQIAVN